LSKRKNTYAVSKPATPTAPNSAGIYQYGPDYSYFIRVQVGEAQQPFYMLLDTGASNTWIMGSDCESDACHLHDTFDPSSSKSWRTKNKGFTIQYGSGNLTGSVGQDTATFAGITHDLSFGLANYTTDDFKHFAFDGILGLATSPSVTGTFLQTLREKKVLDSLIVSISMNRASDGGNDGQVTFGGIDKTKYKGEITYHSIGPDQKEKGEWAVTLDDASLNGKSAGLQSKLAYIDTGTSFIFAFLLLDHRRKQGEQKEEIEDISEVFVKTIDYCRRLSRFKTRDTIRSVRAIFSACSVLHKFEVAQLVNLCPENAEEAKALVPSLENKIDDEELEGLLREMHTKKSFQ
jgi:DNA-directed RNA polymerase subunit F